MKHQHSGDVATVFMPRFSYYLSSQLATITELSHELNQKTVPQKSILVSKNSRLVKSDFLFGWEIYFDWENEERGVYPFSYPYNLLLV